LRSLVAELECRAAGTSTQDRIEASRLGLETAKVIIEWGLLEMTGICIDGKPATKEDLLERGPEPLCEEIAEAVRARSFLSETERKN